MISEILNFHSLATKTKTNIKSNNITLTKTKIKNISSYINFSFRCQHMDYSPWSEMEIWPFLKANIKGQNL